MAIYDTDKGRYYNSKTDKFYDTYEEAVEDTIIDKDIEEEVKETE